MSKLMVIAGEASGDLHGGHVLQHLKTLRPEIELFGTGGKRIAEAGARLFYRVEDLAVIGFFEVAKRYNYYKGIFDELVRKLDEEQPDAVFLVDYPGFNLKFAEEAKKRGIKVIYYIAPQVWAWKKKRIEKLKAFVDELIVLFPFEVDYFRKAGMDTHCFGHPLLDIVKADCDQETFLNHWDLDANKRQISLLPGSRFNEISKHLPLLFETINQLHQQDQGFQYLIPLAPTVSEDFVAPFLEKCQADVRIIREDTYNAVAFSHFALVASGTATLETAVLGTPELIYYKSSFITYLIGKYLLKIKVIGLPNIIANELLVPENPHFTSPKKMTAMLQKILQDEAEYGQLKQNVKKIRSRLGETGAYKKTAELLNSLI